jgi:hypothetical protein
MNIVDKARFLLVQTLSKTGQDETSCPDAILIREEFEERAAIAEYDGGLSRQDAELLAVACLSRRWKLSADEIRGCFDVYRELYSTF